MKTPDPPPEITPLLVMPLPAVGSPKTATPERIMPSCNLVVILPLLLMPPEKLE
jgi:hypothetical protein